MISNLEVDVDELDPFGNQDTIFILSGILGNKKLSKVCLRRGANINAVNKQGQSCLHYCYAYGYPELGDYIISKGADAELKNIFGI